MSRFTMKEMRSMRVRPREEDNGSCRRSEWLRRYGFSTKALLCLLLSHSHRQHPRSGGMRMVSHFAALHHQETGDYMVFNEYRSFGHRHVDRSLRRRFVT